MRSPGHCCVNYLRISCSGPGWPRAVRTCTDQCRSYSHAVFSEEEKFSFHVCKTTSVRSVVAAVAALMSVGVSLASPAAAGPTVCDYPACTPGIMPHVVLGAPCDNTTYYVFGTADYYVSFASQPGRLMFCGSPRRYEPRWFRSPPMAGIKEENTECRRYTNYVAQSPDGLFLVCIAQDGRSFWTRGDT